MSNFRTVLARRSWIALAILVALAVWPGRVLVPRWLGTDDTLWRVVHEQCVPNVERGAGPAPCRAVDLTAGVENGYAVLKDIRGRAQHLLIPTAKITGIESPLLLRQDVPNYFAKAWAARSAVEERLGHPLDRRDVSLAVNAPLRRSQGQLHIHIDCVRRDVREALQRLAPTIGDRWAPLGEPLAGHPYRAIRVLGEDLGASDPFRILADDGEARSGMGERSLAVVGADFGDLGPGFVILEGRVPSRFGAAANGEALQDHACSLDPEPTRAW